MTPGTPVSKSQSVSDNMYVPDTPRKPQMDLQAASLPQEVLADCMHQQLMQSFLPVLVCFPSWIAQESLTMKRSSSYALKDYKIRFQSAERDILKIENNAPNIMCNCFMSVGRQEKVKAENKSFILVNKELLNKGEDITVISCASGHEEVSNSLPRHLLRFPMEAGGKIKSWMETELSDLERFSKKSDYE